jgi:hypothetical protein
VLVPIDAPPAAGGRWSSYSGIQYGNSYRQELPFTGTPGIRSCSWTILGNGVEGVEFADLEYDEQLFAMVNGAWVAEPETTRTSRGFDMAAWCLSGAIAPETVVLNIEPKGCSSTAECSFTPVRAVTYPDRNGEVYVTPGRIAEPALSTGQPIQFVIPRWWMDGLSILAYRLDGTDGIGGSAQAIAAEAENSCWTAANEPQMERTVDMDQYGSPVRAAAEGAPLGLVDIGQDIPVCTLERD